MTKHQDSDDARADTGSGVAVRRRVPRQARSREKVQRILDAARRLLIAEGPEALNTNRLAKESGMSVGSVYEYFTDKHAIAMALIESLAEHETAAIVGRFEDLADAPIPDLVRAIVQLSVALYKEHYALYRSLWAMTPIARNVGSRPGEKLVVEVVKTRLVPIADQLGLHDVELTSWTVFHLVESLATQMAAQSRFSPEQCAQEISTVVLRYLGLPD